MLMENLKEDVILKLREKISLYDEFILDHQKELERLSREAQRFEDYSQGVKESTQKLENHIVLQKKEILELRVKQQLNLDAFNFIDSLLESALMVIKKTSLEGEKISLTKKIELANKNAELSKLNSQKNNCVNEIDKITGTSAFSSTPQVDKNKVKNKKRV